jgi:hypothetical protein
MAGASTATASKVKAFAHEVKSCGNCGGAEGSAGVAKLSACARCGLVVYCSKDCQRSDWKDNHKKGCIAKADRLPQPRATLADCNEAASEGVDCPICLDPVALASATTLPCAHVFHAACVAELLKFKWKQVCPLCRNPIPPSPEQLFEVANLCYSVLERRVEQGKASWSSLTKDEQLKMHLVLDRWRVAAAQGFAMAQFNLGTMLSLGRGVAQSDLAAARWYRKAGDQGHAQAQFNLGNMFAQGRGVAQSDVESTRWYRKAADQGIVQAQCILGNRFAQGRGVAQSDMESTRWYRKAADQGHAQAQCNLGVSFAQGRGVAQSYEEAVRWFRMSADQGHAHAQCNMGYAFAEGRGVAQSDVESTRWYRKSADQGLSQGHCSLGYRA